MPIEFSPEGVLQAGNDLLTNSKTLYSLFDELTAIANSINNNVTGFPEAEELVASLNQINSTKEQIKEAIDAFGNYLINVVAPGYDGFMGALGSVAEGNTVTFE